MRRLLIICCLLFIVPACDRPVDSDGVDIIFINGRVYTFAWGEPGKDGNAASDAPRMNMGWQPDAQALAVEDGKIVFVGDANDAKRYRGTKTRIIDLRGASVIPGLVDSHTHIAELGAAQNRVDLTGVQTEEEAVARVALFAVRVPEGEWIVGRGWDEGAWANHYPTLKLLSERVPSHPVCLLSLHSFAIWGNRLALERAKITRVTNPPAGGAILKDENGEPTGVLLNRATTLLSDAVPPPTDQKIKANVLAGLQRMARDGYVAIHEAGADSRLMRAFEALESEGMLPIRVYAMLSARDPELCQAWMKRGLKISDWLTVRSVKAYYDGALGSRGARLLEDYTDQPGHRGVSGANYGFDQTLVAGMMKAGFQVAIHAIGDAGNRETLDFIQKVITEKPEVKANRNRIEHAQVIHPDDFGRFAKLDVIASMQPPHCVEDKAWAQDRLGPERVKGAYAWRTLRKAGARLIFNSDLTGSDHDIFYGLHAAITRRDKQLNPAAGWYPEERMTPEEALRGYTTWPAYAAFQERQTGVLAPGRWADITVIDIDPIVTGTNDPALLLRGKIRFTMVAGKIVYENTMIERQL